MAGGLVLAALAGLLIPSARGARRTAGDAEPADIVPAAGAPGASGTGD
jgi:hypothetical protein